MPQPAPASRPPGGSSSASPPSASRLEVFDRLSTPLSCRTTVDREADGVYSIPLHFLRARAGGSTTAWCFVRADHSALVRTTRYLLPHSEAPYWFEQLPVALVLVQWRLKLTRPARLGGPAVADHSGGSVRTPSPRRVTARPTRAGGLPISRALRPSAGGAGRRPDVLWGPQPITDRIATRHGSDRGLRYRARLASPSTSTPSDLRGDFDVAWTAPGRRPWAAPSTPCGPSCWAGLRCRRPVRRLPPTAGCWARAWPRSSCRCCAWRGRASRLPVRRRRAGGLGDPRRGPWNAFSEIPSARRTPTSRRAAASAFGRWANVVLGCADLVDDLPRLDGVDALPFDVPLGAPSRGRGRRRDGRARTEPSGTTRAPVLQARGGGSCRPRGLPCRAACWSSRA